LHLDALYFWERTPFFSLWIGNCYSRVEHELVLFEIVHIFSPSRLISPIVQPAHHSSSIRAVGTWGLGGTHPQILTDQLDLSQPGGRLCPPHYYLPLRPSYGPEHRCVSPMINVAIAICWLTHICIWFEHVEIVLFQTDRRSFQSNWYIIGAILNLFYKSIDSQTLHIGLESFLQYYMFNRMLSCNLTFTPT
jgi:hypothetical protein